MDCHLSFSFCKYWNWSAYMKHWTWCSVCSGCQFAGFAFSYFRLFHEKGKVVHSRPCQKLKWSQHFPRRRRWHPTPVLLPGKSHGWRSLVGCSPWGRWGSDTTERLHFHFSLWCIGEGNGNPLQCSCLENPRHRGAWWAAVYGVTQSRTRLKWLSSLAAGLQHARLPCPSPSPQVCSNSCPLSRWYHPTISSPAVPFSSCPQSFPAIRVFSNDSHQVAKVVELQLQHQSFQWIFRTDFL